MTKVQPQDLQGGVSTPGNNKVYGTDGTGTFGFQDVTSNSQNAIDTAGGSVDYTITVPGGTYTDNLTFFAKFNQTNDVAPTLNVNGLGPKQLISAKGNVIEADAININDAYWIRYEVDSDNLIITGANDVNDNVGGKEFRDYIGLQDGAVEYPLPTMDNSNGLIYDGNRYLYIANQNGNTIHKYDTWNNEQVATVGTGDNPYHLLSIDNGYLYVPCKDSNRVDKIDLSTFTNIGNVDVSGNPNSVYIKDGYLYISCEGSNKIDKIDLSTFTNIGNVDVGSLPDSLDIYNGYLYVSCLSSNRVDKIDLSTFTNIGNVGVGSDPRGTTIYNGYLYISCRSSNRVDKIDLSTFTNVGNVGVGTTPSIKSITINNILYVPCAGSNNIYKIDLDTFTVIGTPISVGDGPEELQKVGNYIYCANQSGNSLSKISLQNLTAPATGEYRLYVDSTTGNLMLMDDTGTSVIVGTQS